PSRLPRHSTFLRDTVRPPRGLGGAIHGGLYGAGERPRSLSFRVEVARHRQVAEDALHLGEVVVVHALAAAVAALQAVEYVLPHLARRQQAVRPLAAALGLPLEAPLPGELVGAEEPAFAALRVFIGPLDLDSH